MNRIAEMFDSIAPDYDRLNHILSLGTDRCWRKRAVRAITNPAVVQNILDISCGTGDFSILAARSANPESTVTGLDISAGMLAVMKEKLREEGLAGKVQMVLGDAAALPFSDNSFDSVSIAFGIRNMADRPGVLREVLRVLKPHGKLVILELSTPQAPVIHQLYCLYFKHILPIIGGMVSGDKAAYRYLPASVLAFPKKEEWLRTMGECGFSEVAHRAFSFGICRMYIGNKPNK
ncbi:MAG: bifunctional demethylmenaquinone methyltransferase/2-methoxy-6-polyprenyl-1,4-benzoquinol methylase UbiE [Bacteroidales bacterium]|nr:bifunctional demethylmenaquinone methyltransferase/2-methoxy-6-polyprenyl-1,4-benzoquinol methylase UbiE [Bacteroidales bacterium]